MATEFRYRGFDIINPPMVEDDSEWNLDYLEALQHELQSRLKHLIRSTRELEEAHQANPEDKDVAEAIPENKGVIEKTKKKMAEISELIARVKYIDHSGYWKEQTYSGPHKRPPEWAPHVHDTATSSITEEQYSQDISGSATLPDIDAAHVVDSSANNSSETHPQSSMTDTNGVYL